jgi:hypothetical protein
MTLLERAKEHPTPDRHRPVSEEEIELALAWLKDEITFTQVSRVLLSEKRTKTNAYGRLCVILQEAYQKDRIAVAKG